MGSVTLKRYTS